jgi:hypothetical protein
MLVLRGLIVADQNNVKGKAIPVRSRGGPPSCETSRLSHFLDNRLEDDDKADSLMSQPSFTPKKIPVI